MSRSVTGELARLQSHLKESRQRLLIWVEGPAAWCYRQLNTALADFCQGQGVILGQPDSPLPSITRLTRAELHRVLGTTLDFAVLDARVGFNPNAFGQLCGTIRGGGALLLLTPPAEEWPDFPDPEYASLCVEPYQPADIRGQFLRHLCAGLERSNLLLRWGECTRVWPRLPAVRAVAVPQPGGCLSTDQAEAVRQILALAKQRRAALVLTADRGRGKSAALGIAAARLLQQGKRVTLTAVSRAAAGAALERAEALLPRGAAGLRFACPDELLHRPVDTDLLLIDEAAAIPAPVLIRLLELCPRTVFATTLHGYEGNGQGFALRFSRHLEEQRPRTAEFRLETPIRWAEPDPLEQLSNHILMLDLDTGSPPEPDAMLCLETLDRERLVREQGLLQQLFALLTLAHYRTTPGDLRILLDSPNLTVHALMQAGVPLACALVAQEGPLPEALAKAVWQGRRRPRGHLLPQTLIAQEGWLEAASWQAWRIMRIAVHPALQRRGLGQRLLAELEDRARDAGVDYLGASFAASESLLQFWRASGYAPVRLGEQRDPVAGTHALLVLRPLTAAVSGWLPAARRRYGQSLLKRLAGGLQDLEPERLSLLLADLWQPEAPDGDTLQRLQGFARAQRSLESSLLPLIWLVEQTLPRWHGEGLTPGEQCLLCERILRQKPAAAVKAPAGKRAQLAELRRLSDQLLALLPSG